ncbi:MAG: TAXI family TRAP transporter solute-binding subunit [Pseudomonadota bacterium]
MKKSMKSLVAGLTVAGVGLMSTAALTPVAAKSTFFAIGTGGPTGVYFVVGNAICRMVHKEAAEGRSEGRKHGLRCSAPSTGGSVYNINQIKEGELEFGVAQSDWQYHAFNGTSKFEDNQFDKIRAVFSVHPEPFQIIAGEGTEIKSWDDLAGKTVNLGNPGSGQRATFGELMTAHGVDESYFKATSELTSSEQSAALCDGKIDAYGYTVGVPNAGVAQATDGCGAYIVDLQTDAVKKLVEDNPFYAFSTIPAETYKTTEADVTTFGVMATFVTSADVADDVVYEVVRAVFENLDDFKQLHPAFQNLDPARMVSDGISAPFHPGAEKYFKEKGLL